MTLYNKDIAMKVEANSDKFNELTMELYKKGEIIEKKKRKPTADPVKSSRLRRSRGYNHEYDTVKLIKSIKDWDARRLGGSSVGLPDIVATNNKLGICLVFENKSADAWVIKVPDDEMERMHTTLKLFEYYPHKYFVVALKFKANKQKGRKLSYRFLGYPYNTFRDIQDFTYDIRTDSGHMFFIWGKTDRVDQVVLGKGVESIEELLGLAVSHSESQNELDHTRHT